MTHSGEFQQGLQRALLDAFPNQHALEQMVKFQLNETLAAIAAGGNLTEIVFALLNWAAAQGRTRELVNAARIANPGNATLKAFAERHFPDDAAIQALEALIAEGQQKLNRYEDLARLEGDATLRATLEQNIEQIKGTLLSHQTALADRRAALVAKQPPATPPPATLPPTTFLCNAPYGLESVLVGRAAEQRLLDDWYGQDPAHPLLAVIGLGGQGKSALTWAWLGALRDGNQADSKAPPLLIWWSFYETDGTMDQLMATVLKHFGDEPRAFPSLRAAVDRFLHHLQQTPALLVLDGAERLLRAYSSLAAAYQGDSDSPTLQPGTTANECIDPVTGQLLVWLADRSLTRARTLLTSRLFPKELSGRGGATLAGVRRLDLPGLSLDATQQLFQQLGIRARRAEVEAVCAPLGYHPLSLRLLAQSAAEDPRYRNDLRAAVNYDPFPDLLGKRQHVLDRAYAALPRRAQRLLSQLAAFRAAIAYDVIAAIFGNCHTDLATLERRGLIQATVIGSSGHLVIFDLHPIVRRYAYARLADAPATHVLVVTYFEAIPQPERVQRLDDLLPTIELYHHLVRAERYDAARVLFRDRLTRPLYYQLGAYQQCIDLLRALFPDGLDGLPRLTDERDQAWTLGALANSYSLAGQPAAAIPLFEKDIAICEAQEDKKNLAIGLGNVASMAQIHVGALAAAASNLRRSIALCQEIEERFYEAVGHHALGWLLALCGDWAESAAELETALAQCKEENKIQGQGVVWAYRAEAALRQNEPTRALSAAQEALQLADETARTIFPYERDYVQCHWLLGWANLANGQLDAAAQHLDEALRRCRAINLVELEAKILLAQVRLVLRQTQQPAVAYALLADARTIAERAGYVLDLADIHNLLARLALAAGDRRTARDHAQQARDYAWCDGPPYAYQVALAEAEHLLAELG